MEKRTLQQNKAIHLFCRLLSEELNNAGLDLKKVLKPSVDIPWTLINVKEFIWKPIQQALLLKKSTIELNTDEVNKIWEIINRHLSEKFGLEVPSFPSFEQTEEYIKSLKNKNVQ